MKPITTLLFILVSIFSIAQDNETYAYYCVPCNSGCDAKQFEKPGTCDHCGMALEKMTVKEREMQMNEQMTIAFYLQNGVEVLDFAGPLEVFAYAGYNVFTVSKTSDPIISQGILKIIPDYSIENAPNADILAFFGGNSNVASSDEDVINWVKSQEDIQYHFSVCTGAFILAESQLLDGKTVTTFHSALDNLRNNYPKAKVLDDVRFVDNGKVITTAGISAGIDGALHLVAKLNSLAEAKWIAYHMEYDKWQPGEGLILSDDNPYTTNLDEELKVFEGTYEMDDNLKATIRVNGKNSSLIALVNGKKFPLFQNGKNEFMTVGREMITFKWNDSEVIGYNSEENKFYQKLE